ncbi:TolC family outer membrane protein [Paracoccus sp. (in: a-proteobacteria)]|uniref:TolC family outer membrane protein n=1 Tax=Paracoccus sp. TaxID=267 RepID=UPI003A853695
MFRLAAVATLSIGVALPSWAESLADSMVAAYRHSALIDQNRAVLRAADEDVAAAISGIRPVLEWVGNYSAQHVQDGGTTHTMSLALQAEMVLYDWGRTAIAVDAAKEQVLATRQALVGVEQDVLLSSVQAFFDVRQGIEQVALQQNSVRVIGQERQAALDRFEVGEITVTDVAQADARLAATRATLAAAEGSLEVAREEYLRVTGAKPGTLDAPPPLPQMPANVDAARAVAQKNHPAILQAQRSVAAAELGVAGAVAERNPSLSATGSVGRQRSDASSPTGDQQLNNYASLGLQMRQTLYSGGRLPAAHRKSMALRDEARSVMLNTARQVNQQVGTSWANIEVARAQITAIDQQISAAQQAFDGVSEEAQLGARTTLDVLDAEQSLLQARADKITADANLQLAHYQLLAAMGLLTVEHLKLGIPTYDPSQYYNAVRDAPYTSRQGESLDRVLRAIGRN